MKRNLLILTENNETIAMAGGHSERLGLEVTDKKGLHSGLKAIKGSEIILLDLPQTETALREILSYHPEAVVISLSEKKDGCKAVFDGSFLFLEKPCSPAHMGHALRNASRYLDLREKIISGTAPPKVIAVAQAIAKAMKHAERASAGDMPVLLSGEDGTGKGIIARSVHFSGRRRTSPFVVICAPDEKGLEKAVETARDGSIYVRDCGGAFFKSISGFLETAKASGVRVLCGTADGTHAPEVFKVNIKVPPLRERKEDITPLSELFLKRAAKAFSIRGKVFTKEAMTAIHSHNWPGNVQELEDTVNRACVLSRDGHIEARHLCLEDGTPYSSIKEFLEEKLGRYISKTKELGKSSLYDAVISETEKSLIEIALKETGGNQLKTARALGMNRNTLRAKISAYKIKCKSKRL